MATRINKHFAIIFASVLVGLAVVGFAGKAIFSKSASSMVAAADNALKNGDTQQGIDLLRRAASKDPTNTELLIKLGDVYNANAGDNNEYLGNARGYWNKALTIDENNLEALQRLTDSFADQIQIFSGNGDMFRNLELNAAKLAKVQASRNVDNKAALVRQHMAVLQPWLAGLPITLKEADDSIAALTALSAQLPENAEIAAAIAGAKLRQAGLARQRNDDEAAERSIGEAVASIDASLKGQQKNVDMLNRANRIYEAASFNTTDPKLKEAYSKKADDALNAALALITPENEKYFEVIAASAQRAARQKKPEESQKILRDLLAKKPQDLNVRRVVGTELARDPANRDEAIAILSETIKATDADKIGSKALSRKYMEAAVNLELTKLLIQKARAADNAIARSNAMTELDKRLAEAETFYSAESVPLLRLKAQRLQLRGDNTGAIQMYMKAISLIGTGYPEGDDLKYEAAMALLGAGQTTEARKLLDGIASRFDKHLPTRRLQFDIAMRENNMDEAKKLLDIIEKISPEAAASAIPLRVQYLKKAGDPKAADQFYAKVPEQTREQRLGKAQMAALLEKSDEVIRLASANYKADPKDVVSLDFLIRGLVAAKRNDEAKKLLDAAIAADPKNVGLADARQRLDLIGSDVTPKQRYEKEIEMVNAKEKDPLRKAFLLGEVARKFGNVEDAASHYAAAAAIDPKDPGIISRRFDMALAQGKFDEAQTYLKPLVEAAGDSAPIIQAKFELAKGNAAGALKYARELTKTRAEFADSWVLLGQSQQALRQFGDAVNAYLQARERQAGNFDAVKGLVECYYTLGRPADAGHVIDEGRGLFPDNALFKDMDLVYEVNYGDPEKAIADREQQYKDNPKSALIGLVLADVYKKTAVKKYASDPAKKAAFLKKAEAVVAKGAEAFPQDGRYQSAAAELALAAGKFEAGEARLKAYAAQESMASKPEPMLMLADYYARANKPEQVEGALRDALARSKNVPEIRARLIEFLASQKQYDKALKETEGQTDRIFVVDRIKVLLAAGRGADAEAAMKDAIGKYANDAALYRGMLIDYYLRADRFPDALAQIEPVLKDDPKNIGALYSRAVIRLRSSDAKGAIDDLKRIRGIDPLNLDAAAMLSDAYYIDGVPEKSLLELEDIATKAPGNALIRRKLVERYMQRQDFDNALRLAKEAEATPATAPDPYWPNAVARANAAEGNYADAISAMQRALKKTPQESNLGVFRDYVDLLSRAGQYKLLFETTNDVLSQKRTDWWLLMYRGIARAKGNKDGAGALGDFDAALAQTEKEKDPQAPFQVVSAITTTVGAKPALERVQARAKENPNWRMVVAMLFEASKDHASATREVDQAVTETSAKETPVPLRQSILYRAAIFYQNSSPVQVAKAQAAYEELIKLNKNDVGALNNLAVILSEDVVPPDLTRAMEYSKAAYELVRQSKPLNTHVADTYAWLLVQNNQAKDALQLLLDVVEAEPTLIDARYHLAEAHLQLKEPQAAVDQLKVAMDAIKRLRDEERLKYDKMKSRVDSDMQKAKAMVEAVSSSTTPGNP